MATKVPALPTFTAETKQLLIIGAVGLGIVWLLGKTGLAGKLFEGIAQGTVGAVGGVASGTVKGIGEAVGVPDTNDDKCTIDLANGDMWSASFSCPAPRFMAVVAGRPDLEAEKLKFIRAESAN